MAELNLCKRPPVCVSVAAKKLGISESQVKRLLKDPTSPLMMVRYSEKGDIKVTIESIERCLTPKKLAHA